MLSLPLSTQFCTTGFQFHKAQSMTTHRFDSWLQVVENTTFIILYTSFSPFLSSFCFYHPLADFVRFSGNGCLSWGRKIPEVKSRELETCRFYKNQHNMSGFAHIENHTQVEDIYIYCSWYRYFRGAVNFLLYFYFWDTWVKHFAFSWTSFQCLMVQNDTRLTESTPAEKKNKSIEHRCARTRDITFGGKYDTPLRLTWPRSVLRGEDINAFNPCPNITLYTNDSLEHNFRWRPLCQKWTTSPSLHHNSGIRFFSFVSFSSWKKKSAA